MRKEAIACSTENYGGLRAQKIRYLVIHYTAGNGDTARDNGEYFSTGGRGASAHWFVDDTGAVLSVPEEFVAWHCGGSVYAHPECRNGNSVGVELCSRQDARGEYYFTPQTIANAVALVRELMKKYDIPEGRVIRHYDVTGKVCPAPFVGRGAEDWRRFKEMVMETRYNKVEDVPGWATATVQKLLDRDILMGDGEGLDLSRDMIRMLVVLDRAGTFE